MAVSVQDIIQQKLETAFSPAGLEVVNESHLHSGHAGSPGTGESHFRVTIKAAAFDGKSGLERHRLVNEALAEELAGKVHALALHANGSD